MTHKNLDEVFALVFGNGVGGHLHVKYIIIHSKYFPVSVWLNKTTRTIHHNQLLFTNFGKKLRHIESMTSKVQPAADY